MKLSALANLACKRFGTQYLLRDDAEINAITQDSRQVCEGTLFAALEGTLSNGEHYITQSITKGASAILCRPASAECFGGPAILADNPRKALSELAASYYNAKPQRVVAITGTDGKTSTAEFVRQLWQMIGKPALSIGTLGLKTSSQLEHMPVLSDNTTPESVRFYQAIASAGRQGVTHVVCEASSHGLDQYRLDGLRADAAIFTSFSQDHLDYHPSMEAYFAAKARLFTDLLSSDGLAICCSDYEEIATFAATLPHVLTYGKQGNVTIDRISPIKNGQNVALTYQGNHYDMYLPLFGEFQVYNVIAAMLAVAHTAGVRFHTLIPYAARLDNIAGRLQLVGTTKDNARIFVDYAHTAGALEKALNTLKPYAKNTLHLVFGCGGDRDKTKRAQMGKVAERLADHVIVTDDNPRTEDAAEIRRTILQSCAGGRDIADRASAIRQAVSELRQGDVLLIAGKGHENYQIIGTTKTPFDDVKVVQEALSG